MKKNTLIYLIITVLVVIILCTLLFNKNELKDESAIASIVDDSNLELILNLDNFSINDYANPKLLEVSMQLAEKVGLMNESYDDGYLQYVNANDLHELIKGLTGINLEAPIQIDDFYYVYDSENEYYYCVPVQTVYYDIENINHIYEKDGIYTIECIVSKTQDDELIETKTITTKIKNVEGNTYLKYQLISQEVK